MIKQNVYNDFTYNPHLQVEIFHLQIYKKTGSWSTIYRLHQPYFHQQSTTFEVFSSSIYKQNFDQIYNLQKRYTPPNRFSTVFHSYLSIFLYLCIHLTQLFKVNLQMNLDKRLAKNKFTVTIQQPISAKWCECHDGWLVTEIFPAPNGKAFMKNTTQKRFAQRFCQNAIFIPTYISTRIWLIFHIFLAPCSTEKCLRV